MGAFFIPFVTFTSTFVYIVICNHPLGIVATIIAPLLSSQVVDIENKSASHYPLISYQ